RKVARVQGGRRDARTAERSVPVQTYSREPDQEGISGHRALDIKRARQRIAACGSAHTLRIGPTRIDAPRFDGVTRKDRESRRNRRREVAMKFLRLETVSLRLRGLVREASRGPRQRR